LARQLLCPTLVPDDALPDRGLGESDAGFIQLHSLVRKRLWKALRGGVPVIALLILAISIAALVQFFVSYCRSLVSVYAKVEISREAMESAGLPAGHVDAGEFSRLIGLVRQCRVVADDSTELGAVRLYYAVLTALEKFCLLLPASCSWFHRERSGCAHMVGVALDRRMVFLRQSA